MSLDPLAQEAVDLLKRLVAIPSISGNEQAAADFLQGRLKAFFPTAAVARSGHNIYVTVEGKAPGPTLLLCTHIDTVAVAKGWMQDPFGATVEGDKIYGLGANDAGASVVSMISALRLALPLARGRVVLCLAAEEEAGGQGFVKIENELPRYDAAIFGEPTDMGVATAMRGAMRAILHSHGKACHASRPWEGFNAIDNLVKDIHALRCIDLKDASQWGGATIEPTVIRGGESPNQIPALIETTLDIRTTPEKNNEWVAQQLKQAGLDIQITFDRRKPMHNDPQSKLVQAVRAAVPGAADYTFNGTCDMAFATAPSIVMGPGVSDRSHIADEFIRVPEIAAAIPVYAGVIKAFLD